ncbi:MAG: ferrochelatase [Acidimicrobiales bacterium]|nr:ferrochelatase [Acidimicrobiales bacterium]RZV45129.1 MAG: ferrochelatase [Acidimicrobiales bacterium]
MSEVVPYDAILLVSFGGPEGPDDVVPFLENVTRGRGIPRERLEQVGAHYKLFGGKSPINDQCRALLADLKVALAGAGIDLPVYWGNRNWDPMLEDTIGDMADDGVEHALAFVTSATSSYSGCRQYREDIERAREAVGDDAPKVDKIRQYYDHPGFIEPMIDNTRRALEEAPMGSRLVFTAHSLPLSMASTSDYEAQLREAARLVAEGVGEAEWDLVWQSRSGPAQMPWLEPDINDHLEAIGPDASGVVMVPIGFISDHMEVIYDLDTEAAATCRTLGLPFVRAATVGTDERFVTMIVDLVEERRRGVAPKALGSLAVRPDFCLADCCPQPQRPPAR